MPSPTISHSSPAICILNAELMIMDSEVACAIRALLPEFAHWPKHPFIHDPTDVIASRIMGPAPTADRTLGSAPTYQVWMAVLLPLRRDDLVAVNSTFGTLVSCLKTEELPAYANHSPQTRRAIALHL